MPIARSTFVRFDWTPFYPGCQPQVFVSIYLSIL